MADVPFLGCKISLISKCDIRYEGILYCVDPKESTIALSKVKSYGTEDRGDPGRFVGPKNDVYDLITFRASDVKDLRVDPFEPPGLSDPAIVSARQSGFDGNRAPMPTSGPSQAQQQPLQQQQQTQQKPLLPFMPSGTNNKEPSSSSAQQLNQQTTVNYSSVVKDQRRARPDNINQNKRSNQQEIRESREGPRRDNRERRDNYERRDQRSMDRPRNDRRDNDRRDDRRDGDRRDNDRRDFDDRRRNDGGRPPRNMRGGGFERNHVNPRYNNSNNRDYNPRRGPNNRDENSKGPNFRRGPMQGGRRGRSGDRSGAPRGPRKSAPLKFDGEYDFDEANKLFLEMDSKFKDMKVKVEEKDGERANSKSPEGNSETGSGYDSEDANKDGDSRDGTGGSVSGEFYDKTKSFFDNISCEASERSQGKVNKPDWRKERQINAETFGVSANYRRGGYRGRSYGSNGYHRR